MRSSAQRNRRKLRLDRHVDGYGPAEWLVGSAAFRPIALSMYLRLRLAHRLCLLGPLLRLQRGIETWAAVGPSHEVVVVRLRVQED